MLIVCLGCYLVRCACHTTWRICRGEIDSLHSKIEALAQQRDALQQSLLSDGSSYSQMQGTISQLRAEIQVGGLTKIDPTKRADVGLWMMCSRCNHVVHQCNHLNLIGSFRLALPIVSAVN